MDSQTTGSALFGALRSCAFIAFFKLEDGRLWKEEVIITLASRQTSSTRSLPTLPLPTPQHTATATARVSQASLRLPSRVVCGRALTVPPHMHVCVQIRQEDQQKGRFAARRRVQYA